MTWEIVIKSTDCNLVFLFASSQDSLRDGLDSYMESTQSKFPGVLN